MDNDEFTPPPIPPEQPLPEPPYSRRKDPYAEPPVKDFSHLLNGGPAIKPFKHGGRKLLIVLLILVLIVGGGAYWKFGRTKSVAPVKHAATKTQPKATTPQTIPTTSYSSTGFGVTFNYPQTWTIQDEGTSSLSITSPAMQLKNASGKSVQGKIIFLMEPQNQIPSGFSAGTALAVLPSQLVPYTNPGSDQTAQTYISFIQYSSATVVGTLNGIYVTGNYGYQKGQIIPGTDIAALTPLITVTFGQCTTTTCTSLQDLSITSSEWNNSAVSTPVLTILKSLSFS